MYAFSSMQTCIRTTRTHQLVHFQCRYLSTRPDRLFLSTSVTKSFSVPLTLADAHLRDEQLPFAYAFKETLDRNKLISSLKEVLQRYPILGSTPDFTSIPMLVCSSEDTVPLSFGVSDLTLEEWLEQKRSGQMQHVGWQSGGGAPILSPLFDDLVTSKWAVFQDLDGTESDNQFSLKKEHVATVRVTYFKNAGTAIAININHMLGDANSCFRICQVWGRAMRGLQHPSGACNIRANATLTGMISPEMALILNLGVDGAVKDDASNGIIFPFFQEMYSFVDSLVGVDPNNDEEFKDEEVCSSLRDHEYARLEHSVELLHAMKSYGIIHCSSNNLHRTPSNNQFISTNDMITAMGWLMKRRISQKLEWNLSMVVNLRS
jgi:hypothetical protein